MDGGWCPPRRLAKDFLSEVFEHIPFPYIAHRGVYRILRLGGEHVFTVPFVLDSEEDDISMSSLIEVSSTSRGGRCLKDSSYSLMSAKKRCRTFGLPDVS